MNAIIAEAAERLRKKSAQNRPCLVTVNALTTEARRQVMITKVWLIVPMNIVDIASSAALRPAHDQKGIVCFKGEHKSESALAIE